jgi:PilZ domain-containing protein
MNVMTGSPPNDAGTQDRRKNQRVTRCLKGAYIEFNETRVECVIRDESKGGARLQFSNTSGIPNIFILHLKSSLYAWPCRVAWRSKDHIGVEFL